MYRLPTKFLLTAAMSLAALCSQSCPCSGQPVENRQMAPEDLPAPQLLQPPQAKLSGPLATPSILSLPQLVQLAVEQNPALSQAQFAIDAARGRMTQAGLYPNPTISFNWSELGDVQGPSGINTLPMVTQEIVTAGKLGWKTAVALQNVQRAQLALQNRRMQLMTSVRKDYFRVLTLQQQISVLEDLAKLGAKALKTAELLHKAEQIAELDVLQIRVELRRFNANLEAARRLELGAWRRLAARIGSPYLPPTKLAGSIDESLPNYQIQRLAGTMLQRHPQVHAANVEVQRAKLSLEYAKAKAYPNVTIGSGYIRQNQNKSDDWLMHIQFPVPLFNRNQGNIQAARAEIGQALQQVKTVELGLLRRLSVAIGDYAAARERASRYRDGILKDAERAYTLSLKAFKGGQFAYLRLIQAQRTFAEARLEYINAQSRAWQAACDIAGLLQQESLKSPTDE